MNLPPWQLFLAIALAMFGWYNVSLKAERLAKEYLPYIPTLVVGTIELVASYLVLQNIP